MQASREVELIVRVYDTITGCKVVSLDLKEILMILFCVSILKFMEFTLTRAFSWRAIGSWRRRPKLISLVGWITYAKSLKKAEPKVLTHKVCLVVVCVMSTSNDFQSDRLPVRGVLVTTRSLLSGAARVKICISSRLDRQPYAAISCFVALMSNTPSTLILQHQSSSLLDIMP